jgi:hypothetical protein
LGEGYPSAQAYLKALAWQSRQGSSLERRMQGPQEAIPRMRNRKTVSSKSPRLKIIFFNLPQTTAGRRNETCFHLTYFSCTIQPPNVTNLLGKFYSFRRKFPSFKMPSMIALIAEDCSGDSASSPKDFNFVWVVRTEGSRKFSKGRDVLNN